MHIYTVCELYIVVDIVQGIWYSLLVYANWLVCLNDVDVLVTTANTWVRAFAKANAAIVRHARAVCVSDTVCTWWVMWCVKCGLLHVIFTHCADVFICWQNCSLPLCRCEVIDLIVSWSSFALLGSLFINTVLTSFCFRCWWEVRFLASCILLLVGWRVVCCIFWEWLVTVL